MPTSWHVTRWYADPYSRGAYSTLLPGGRAEHRDILARPIAGRLVFAGEAVNAQNPGMTHGAWDSGMAAAHYALAAGARRVIVVGAGFAGLAAASSLAAKGIQVVVLEARDRIGGRAHTLALGRVRVDVGAAWLQQFEHNSLARYAKSLGLEMVETDFSQPLSAAADGRLPDIDAAYAALKAGVDRSLPLKDGVALYLASLSAAERRAARYAIEANLIAEAGLPLEQLSADALDEPGVGNGDRYLPQGYIQLVEHAARGLDIRLERPVSSISWHGQGARVENEVGDFCICSAPAGALKDLKFTPGLPVEHRQALAYLGMGMIEKVVLQFSERWWPVSRSGYLRWFDTPANWGEWLDLTDGVGVPTVAGLIAADGVARHYQAHSDQQVALAAAEKFSAWANALASAQ
ncbi:MAG: FAD-dependent oxidoreductase [Pseudomonas sp.]